MDRIITVLCACIAITTCQSAVAPDDALREVAAVSRTNLTLALALGDKLVAAQPTNAQALTLRARLLERARKYDDAIRDLSAALKLDPSSPQLWQGRGEVHFKAAHIKESIADFDHVLAAAPAQAPHHWQRGIALYYAGRFADGRKQFELHQTVNPNDVENAVWHFLCAARETSLTNARARLLAPGKDARIPMQEIYEFYRGSRTKEEVLAVATRAANDMRVRDALFYAHLYLGLYYEVAGEPAQAREHLKRAAEDANADHYMGDVARVHLQTLTARAPISPAR
jgi:lipoprotein NlpI